MNTDIKSALIDFNDVTEKMVLDLFKLTSAVSRTDVVRFSKLVCQPVKLVFTAEYIEFVKAWRKLVIYGVSYDHVLRQYIPKADCFIRKPGSVSLDTSKASEIRVFHTCVLLFWKVKLPSKPEPWDAFKHRVSTSGRLSLEPDLVEDVARELARVQIPADWVMLRGQNGPGAVAGGEKNVQKWLFRRRPARVSEMLYRFDLRDYWRSQGSLEPIKFGVTRALQVPKDARGPRYISCEPLEFQFAQFALANRIFDEIHRLYPEHVSLRDQAHHCRLLQDPCFCTIDLKDASDMVSRSTIWRLLKYKPGLRRLLFECRSSFTQVDGDLVPLRTFAPMGSSLCFVVMTWLIIAAIKSRGYSFPFSVYGDDLIVHKNVYYDIIDLLVKLGFKVNTTKSCGPYSHFRESCGQEWFWENATHRWNFRPVYVRELLPSKSCAFGLIQKADELGVLDFAGLRDVMLSSVRRSRFGWVLRVRKRWNKALQRWEIQVPLRKGVEEILELKDYPGLFRWATVGSSRERPLATIDETGVHNTGGFAELLPYNTPRQILTFHWVDELSVDGSNWEATCMAALLASSPKPVEGCTA